ncbi:MAG TPA: 23S rRNA (uracil(1939)-C(5))-methyltransferase RlmD [Steroidobacteraceae bacterium]|nr:23S rRNA (uracil(1939)-C(5))-methyltransferase RlmD [Steroidobacteraceae bacterium]
MARPPSVEETFEIESLTHDGRGVARPQGKAVFVHGALPGEQVTAKRVRRHRNYDEAIALHIGRPAPERVTPRCPHFGVCGGCVLQHLAPEAQLAAKERQLFEELERVGHVSAAERLPPVAASPWGYRRRARLGVKYVPKKGGVLVGFRESLAPLIAEIGECHVLPPRVSGLLRPLALMIETLTIRSRLPQIEVSVADTALALVLRVLDPPTPADREALSAFAARHELEIYLQGGGLDSVQALTPPATALSYSLAREDVRVGFLPTDFIQVNAAVNELLVARAIQELDPRPGDSILDLYCGLGNFTLPLARRAGRVTGIEGDAGLVARARANASSNGIANAEFHVANLAEALPDYEWNRQRYDLLLLDPPRVGAPAVLGRIARWRPRRVVYVSCQPSSLARDAGVLVRELGYTLGRAGVIDMFAHTAHVESMAVFDG